MYDQAHVFVWNRTQCWSRSKDESTEILNVSLGSVGIYMYYKLWSPPATSVKGFPFSVQGFAQFGRNSAADWARELFKPSVDAEGLAVSIKKI